MVCFCCCHLSYVRFADGRVRCVQLCVVRGQSVFWGLFEGTFWAVFGHLLCICAGQKPSKEKSEDFMLPDLLSAGNVLDWWHESKDQGFKSAVRCEFRRCFRESHIGCCAVQIQVRRCAVAERRRTRGADPRLRRDLSTDVDGWSNRADPQGCRVAPNARNREATSAGGAASLPHPARPETIPEVTGGVLPEKRDSVV